MFDSSQQVSGSKAHEKQAAKFVPPAPCEEFNSFLDRRLVIDRDYGYFKDQSTNNSGKLLGIGFGFGLITKNGLFNIVYGNGSSQNQAIKLSNSIVQISLKTNF